ncbi:integrase core domain-containing protein [uncultured Actinomyces sp.]|uniref:integrase core domain-containing protein n=1 Tax=uncultured Actinomyces sp. TaxID=249061 RepID=UPI0025E777B8|nr:integrase core domain-containing protein [uncultured Actinomyces sp.]
MWQLWPFSPIIDEVHEVIFVDGIHLGPNAVVLIAQTPDCVLGWYAARSEISRAWSALMSRIAPPALVVTALDMAATTRGGFPTGVVLHADRGTQFTSEKLAAYMRAVKGRVSMGRAGVCWDNAMAESFWATLKTEYYYRRTFTTRDQVYTGVATWIEDFYNRRRIHTSLGGKSPIEYELHQAAWTKAA